MLTLAVALAVGQCCELLNVSMTGGDANGTVSMNFKRVKFQDLGNNVTEADASLYGNITGEPEFTYVMDYFNPNEEVIPYFYVLLRYIPFWKDGETNDENLKKIRTAVDNNPTWIFGFFYFSFKTEECPENSETGILLLIFLRLTEPIPIWTTQSQSRTKTSASLSPASTQRKRRTDARGWSDRGDCGWGRGRAGCGGVRGVPAFLGKDAWGLTEPTYSDAFKLWNISVCWGGGYRRC